LTYSLLLICGLCFGQNLVPNPSFEEYDSCHTGFEQISSANGWYGFSTEYFNSCSPVGLFSFGVPSNDLGYQDASTGKAYGGLHTHGATKNYREYIGRRLLSPLAVGTKYFVSFKVSLVDYSDCATNNIGIIFTKAPYNKNEPPPILNYSTFYSQNIIYDKLNWSTIAGSFLADSAYEYIALGNFFSDFLTNISSSGSGCDAYYYLDDVCVSTDSLACGFSVGINELQKTAITLFPNPFSNQLTFSLAANEPTTISLYDFLGQQILQQTFTNSTTINTEQMQAGIYFYELSNSKEILKTGKVVKQ